MEFVLPIQLESIPGPCKNDAETDFEIRKVELPKPANYVPVPLNIRRCQECGKFGVELRKCGSMGQVFWLCRPDYEKAIAEKKLIPLQRKLTKAEKKRLKKQKHWDQIQAKKEKRSQLID